MKYCLYNAAFRTGQNEKKTIHFIEIFKQCSDATFRRALQHMQRQLISGSIQKQYSNQKHTATHIKKQLHKSGRQIRR